MLKTAEQPSNQWGHNKVPIHNDGNNLSHPRTYITLNGKGETIDRKDGDPWLSGRYPVINCKCINF